MNDEDADHKHTSASDSVTNTPITDGGTDPGDTDNAEEEEEEETKHILVRAPEPIYDDLSKTKDDNGFTWLGMLLHAQRDLQRHNQRVKSCDKNTTE